MLLSFFLLFFFFFFFFSFGNKYVFLAPRVRAFRYVPRISRLSACARAPHVIRSACGARELGICCILTLCISGIVKKQMFRARFRCRVYIPYTQWNSSNPFLALREKCIIARLEFRFVSFNIFTMQLSFAVVSFVNYIIP